MRALKITKSITSRDAKSIDHYLREISHFDVLSPEEEVQLFNDYQGGDMEALEKIVNHNLRFVVSVAKQYAHGSEMALGDLINEGNLGLIKAAQRFDISRGFKFISYAVWWIRQSILQAINERNLKIRIPSNFKNLKRKIKNEKISFLQLHEREPTREELSQILDISDSKVLRAEFNGQKCVSLDAELSDDSSHSLSSIMIDESLDAPDQKLDVDSLKGDVQQLLSCLEERQSQILCRYFGIGYSRPQTMEEISNLFGMSRERIRQVKNRAIRTLKRQVDHPLSQYDFSYS